MKTTFVGIVLAAVISTLAASQELTKEASAFLSKKLASDKYELIETPFLVDNEKLFTAIMYKDGKRKIERIPQESKVMVEIVDRAVFFSIVPSANIKIYLLIEGAKVTAGNDELAIVDISGSKYAYLKFYGWQMHLSAVRKKTTESYIRIEPYTHDGKGITDGFTIHYGRQYSQFYTLISYPIALHIVDLREPLVVQMARAGLQENWKDIEPGATINKLKGLSQQDKRLLKNAVFALHNYNFNSQDLLDYFLQFKWYQPDESVKNSTDILSSEQRRLIEVIQEIEAGTFKEPSAIEY